MKITVNNKEVENPLARFLLAATAIVFVMCMLVLLATFAIILIPLIIIIIVIGTIAQYGFRHKK